MAMSESGICTHIFLTSVQVEYKMTVKINIYIAQYFFNLLLSRQLLFFRSGTRYFKISMKSIEIYLYAQINRLKKGDMAESGNIYKIILLTAHCINSK